MNSFMNERTPYRRDGVGATTIAHQIAPLSNIEQSLRQVKARVVVSRT